ncbi:hypothetical protein [Alistipes sp.]|uniref:hypothetical protein n=1 Tax=Alistipes sp. TaxID=1872444 RepID=UPI003AB44625
MSKTEFIGQAAPEQIEEWKGKYGDIFAIRAEEHICYLRKPTRKAISYASVAGKIDPLKFNETLLRECWLGGSEEIRKNDDLFLAASGVLDQIIEVKEAQLEKL